jgi:hypothetical protein
MIAARTGRCRPATTDTMVCALPICSADNVTPSSVCAVPAAAQPGAAVACEEPAAPMISSTAAAASTGMSPAASNRWVVPVCRLLGVISGRRWFGPVGRWRR